MNFTPNECEIGKADRDPSERIEANRINKNKHGALWKDVNEDRRMKKPGQLALLLSEEAELTFSCP
jgi:hypothetical protein